MQSTFITGSRGLLALVAFLASGYASAQRIQMEATPVFDGLTPAYGVTAPMEVVIENPGPNASDTLQVRSDRFQMGYPVELPQGARKRIIVYPEGGLYDSNLIFTLITDRGRITALYPLENNLTQGTIVTGLVSEVTGRTCLSSAP